MQVEGNQLRLVATDGHRLAYAASQIEAELPKTEVILPRKTVLELFKLLSNPSESITVELWTIKYVSNAMAQPLSAKSSTASS